MSKRGKLRKRKIRRAHKKVLKFGPKSKSTHNLVAGRTGGVHSKKLKSRKCNKSRKCDNGGDTPSPDKESGG